MAEFNLSVADNVITLDSRPDVVTSGSVNIYTAAFALDESWEGYTCRACFACGPERSEAVITDGQCVVPWEVLRANGYLRIGVYGTKGDQSRPTIWTRESVYITPGAEPGEETNPPSPTVFDQLVQTTTDNRVAAESARDEAAAAANRAQTDALTAEAAATEADAKVSMIKNSHFALSEEGHLIWSYDTTDANN